jgi:undecaprenyl-phosphate galactose phosphotransferase
MHFDFWEETKRLYLGLIFGLFMVLFWLVFAKHTYEFSRFVIIGVFGALFFLMPVQKRIVKLFLTKVKLWKKSVMIVGNKEDKQKLVDEFTDNWYLGLHVKDQADTVLIASRGYDALALSKLSETYLLRHKEVLFVPTLHHINFADATILELHNIRISLIQVANRLQNPWVVSVKIIFDFLLTFALLPFFIPLLAIIALAIKLDSSGPVFFKQTRLGRNGQLFTCYKFRTMYCDSATLLERYLSQNPHEIINYSIYHKYTFDPRITPVGKWLRSTSLDELPQLFNLLKGQMSLIGPRPYMENERVKLGSIERDILLVKPGITGLWQVSGRNTLTFEERIELDRWYIRNWSFWLDIIIFIKTIKVVLSKHGAK